MTEQPRSQEAAPETTVRHRYQLPDGRAVRHVHRFGQSDPPSMARHGRLVRDLLDNLDIAQTEVAAAAGITPAHLNRMMAGRYPIPKYVGRVIQRMVGYGRDIFTTRTTP